ncbi:MAG TPA: ABC transporter ATP-binding protein [Candidatus Saccharimonadales bacterium]|nr:ABC transporter ATP-binding protein [Candidatus Saccharimonadales bacterium]
MAKNSTPVLEVTNLAKKFGDFNAVNGISFSLDEGQILGFLGPNGAGKSTTINCLLGVIAPDAGEIKILGKELFANKDKVMKYVNYCSAEYNTAWSLTVYEALVVYAKLYGIDDYKKRIDEVLEEFEAMEFKNKFIRELSFGQRARISLCKAVLNKPKLLLLDEPMASMDPDVVDKGIEIIKRVQKEYKISILYTSHNMWEIEEVADRVVFVNHGKIIASGTPLELTKQEVDFETKEPNLREVFIKLSRKHDMKGEE